MVRRHKLIYISGVLATDNKAGIEEANFLPLGLLYTLNLKQLLHQNPKIPKLENISQIIYSNLLIFRI